jgi:Cytochrome P460
MHRHHMILIAALAVIATVGPVACGGTDASNAPATSTAETPATTSPAPSPKKSGPTAIDLKGMDAADAALIAGYLGWTELSKPPIAELQSLGGAHPGDKRIWASPQRDALTDGTAQTFPYPDGTVIVKQAQTAGTVTLIALMEKTGNADPSNGGWRYVEYTRPTADAPLAKVGLPESGCADCHSQANAQQKTDWVFWSLQ